MFATRKEGYIDPKTKKFIGTSENKMRVMMRTDTDESVRKACFEAMEKMAIYVLDDYVKLVKLRNEFAKILGYKDFYDYKIQIEEGMTKKELFYIFDSIYSKTKFALKNIRGLEKTMPGLKHPWNFSFMMSGNFTSEEDKYFQFDEALMRWGKSFSALGVNFRKSKIYLDLLDRKGKYSNGFCHWPEIISYQNGKRLPGRSNFTCNVVFGQVGSGVQGYATLFHEGGHAAHMLNSDQTEVCINHEYAPMSTAWAETQSMFLDTIFGSIDWKTRYAKDKSGNSYPMELFERKTKKLHLLRPTDIYGIMFVCDFEKQTYEEDKLDKNKVLNFAKRSYKKYYDMREDSLSVLNVPHIYSWESAASYHGYGLATIALTQWREYFHKKYGYIVDNPNVGREMTKVWKLAASKTFSELVKIATNKKLSPEDYVESITLSIDELFKKVNKRLQRMKKVKSYNKKVNLNAEIHMVSGKKEISNNTKSFEDMATKYKIWLNKGLKK